MPRHSTTPTAPLAPAFSYIRFSHPSQAEGDSLRRQTTDAAAWCQRHGAQLDTATTLHDLGRSAFTGAHRKNPDRHALASFLKLVEQGRVPRGAFLVIENLDRLSREHIRPALTLLLNLIEAGVRVVQLKPVEQVFDEDVEPMALMMAIMELSRGHSESQLKSERLGPAWVEKRRRAREDGIMLTHQLPAWVREENGELSLIPDRAAVVKHIFALKAGGYGFRNIVKRLVEEGIPPFGEAIVRPGRTRSAHSGRWTKPYIIRILNDRRAVGEFQPCGKGRKPEGPPIPNYFPAAVTEEEFLAARPVKAYSRQPTRIGKYINLFSGLIRNGRDGLNYMAATKYTRLLVAYSAEDARGKLQSFPLDIFERSVLSLLRELDPHDILNGDSGPDETQVLAGQLERVEASIAMIVEEMNRNGESPVLFGQLRLREEEKRQLVQQLTEARQKAAHPLSESWGEAQSLMAILDNSADPTDTRLRLRAALKRIVSEIWILVVPRKRERLCAVQVYFADRPVHRNYLIYYRAAGHMRKCIGNAWSLAEVVKPGRLDLRHRDDAMSEDAVKLERALEKLDLSILSVE
jgi:DNA invertase Pin-like site-specific DNA recombinase